MKEKEAREIIKAKPTLGRRSILCSNPEYAAGYLEAIGKANGLVDCLKRIQKQYQGYSGDLDPDIEKTLAQWEKEK